MYMCVYILQISYVHTYIHVSVCMHISIYNYTDIHIDMCKAHHPLGMLSPPNQTPQCIFSQVVWNMLRKHHCLSMCIELPRTYIRCWISILPHTWWSPTVVGWKLVLIQQKFCSRESTNYLIIQQNEKSTQYTCLPTYIHTYMDKYIYSCMHIHTGSCMSVNIHT